jgi:hypothetical protein
MPNIGTTGKLVLAFVTLLIGVVLIGTISTEGLSKTTKTVVVDESIDYSQRMVGNGTVNESAANDTLANVPTTWKVSDCLITDINITNGSGTQWTADTDYILVGDTGVFSVLNTTLTNFSENFGNISLVDYNYCGDDYMNLSWGRTLINLVPGFFGIAILLTSVGLFFSVAKDYGIF